MASKALVTFNVLLVAFILEYVLRLPIVALLSNTFTYPSGYSKSPEFYGFNFEEHNVTTEDGYILTIFRMNGKHCDHRKKTPVILMHGLLQSSDAWLDAGPEAGLAYLISDACHDLWIGNQRGNYYSRKHVKLNPDRNPEFWQFSVDEIGFYDVPATVNYVLKYTGQEKLNFVGYSQGAGTFFIMCSERPGYCEKANVLIGIAPAARQTHTKSLIYRTFVKSVTKLESVLIKIGVHEVFAKGSFAQGLLAIFCNLNSISVALCEAGIGVFDSNHPGSITPDTLRVMSAHFPAGTSLHNMARYGQSMTSKLFQKFDYGQTKNLQLYGDARSPTYNLSAVTVPFVALYGKNDHLVDTKDVSWLIKKLPNVLESVEVSDPLWNHFDVTYSQFTNKIIFPKIDEYLSKYNDVQ